MQSVLLADNNVTKTFKVNSPVGGEIDVFITKAFDEDSNVHFLVINIPIIPKLKVERIQYPISFQSEDYRNMAYEKEVNENWLCNMIAGFEKQLIYNKLKQTNHFFKASRSVKRMIYNKKNKNNGKAY